MASRTDNEAVPLQSYLQETGRVPQMISQMPLIIIELEHLACVVGDLPFQKPHPCQQGQVSHIQCPFTTTPCKYSRLWSAIFISTHPSPPHTYILSHSLPLLPPTLSCCHPVNCSPGYQSQQSPRALIWFLFSLTAPSIFTHSIQAYSMVTDLSRVH